MKHRRAVTAEEANVEKANVLATQIRTPERESQLPSDFSSIVLWPRFSGMPATRLFNFGSLESGEKHGGQARPLHG